jgi:hypothetical protein
MEFEQTKRILAAFDRHGVHYRMKKDTVRPQDRLDAQALRERFDLQEE